MIPFPNKKYSVIYADPPWSYRQGGRGAAKNHYDTMSAEQLCRMPVRDICTDDAVLFMWATFPNLPEALKVMQDWGFTYKTAAFVWVKQNKKSSALFMGGGSYTRANGEVCLIGVSKNTKASRVVASHSVRQIIVAPVRHHSQKPSEARSRIRELMGVDRSYIELFARNTTPVWDVWGNEVNKYD
nr:MAG TPA: N6 adenosine methyltransferase subunit [Caudoviricetes sp.]